MIVSGTGDWAVLCNERLALFPTREQALAYARFLIDLGLEPELWKAVENQGTEAISAA